MTEFVEQAGVQVVTFLVIATLVVFGRWLRKIHQLTAEVNHAVNNRPENQPTIYELTEHTVGTLANLHEQFNEHVIADQEFFTEINGKLDEMKIFDEAVATDLATGKDS